jgi:hypothetical protein
MNLLNETGNEINTILGNLPDFTKGKQALSFNAWFGLWRELNDVSIQNDTMRCGEFEEQLMQWSDFFFLKGQDAGVNWSEKAIEATLQNAAYWERARLLTSIVETLKFNGQGYTCPQLETLFPGQYNLAHASLSQLIWQIKRKAAGLKVWDHLFLNIYSSQNGSSKSYFASSFGNTLSALFFECGDTNIFEDTRFVETFNQYLLIMFDEMAKFDAKDVAKIKALTSSGSVLKRKMRTTSVGQIKNISTFIGTANRSLVEIYHDPTGMRRFVELEMAELNKEQTKERLTLIDTIDWLAFFRSVDENGESPVSQNRQLFEVHQEELRKKDLIELWAEDRGYGFGPNAGDKYVPVKLLAADYLEWLKANDKGKYQLDAKVFGKKIKGLLRWTEKRTSIDRGYFVACCPTDRLTLLTGGKK